MAAILHRTVPNFVPSGDLDTLSSTWCEVNDSRIFTSESERIQTTLKC